MSINQSQIRNFCIIAHIDHGKSTLADRFLELTGTVEKRKMKEQVLDQMEIERERGITIKLQPVRMVYKTDKTGEIYQLNLIDTPGHVDFSYEVSRSLAAVEGAILLVDATQGVQAQTVANFYLAKKQNLTIIPAINKIDLPNAEAEKTKREIINLLSCRPEDIFLVSAKTGEGAAELLQAVAEKVPAPDGINRTDRTNKLDKTDRRPSELRGTGPPKGGLNLGLRALIFDSKYDEYRGVIVYARIFEGEVKAGDRVKFMATGARAEVLEVGYFGPELRPLGRTDRTDRSNRTDRTDRTAGKKGEKGEKGETPRRGSGAARGEEGEKEGLGAGEIGYIVTGLKTVADCRVGDTVASPAESQPLPGYSEVKPMVYAGIFAQDGEAQRLREAISKLKLNDAALVFESERSQALGFGFRCGFLGLLHLEIFTERLKREFGLEIIVTVPSVAYEIIYRTDRTDKGEKGERGEKGGETARFYIHSPQEMPAPEKIVEVREPLVKLDIFTPKQYLGATLSLLAQRHGQYLNTEYLEEDLAVLHYRLPLAELLVNFYDQLKSVSSGFGSMNYELTGWEPCEVVKLEILVAESSVEALASLVYRDEAYRAGKKIVEALKAVISRQQFVVKIQAAVGGKIIAAERLSALRKDVTAKLYGGDYSRKRKLLEKQKRGKKKMLQRGAGQVELPPAAFLAVLKR